MTGPDTPARRLAALHPDGLDDAQRRLYDAIVGGPRGSGPRHFPLTDADGRLHGPFDAMLRSPGVGQALQGLGSALRYGTGLADRVREIVILAVAAAEDSGFERFAHEAVGRAVGLTDGEMAAVRHGDDLPATGAGHPAADRAEATALRAARSLLADGDLDDDLYRELMGAFGEPGAFELITLVGYYRTLALQLRVFRVPVPG